MTGIFQLFDHQEMLTTGRITGHSLKRHPNGGSHFNNAASDMESNIISNRSLPMEKHSNKHAQDKQTIYTQSSRFPSSSLPYSCSSSSPDFSKTSQQDALSFDQMIFPETSSIDPRMSQLSTTPQLHRQSHYLREIVKDSLHQEARGLPSKTKAGNKTADYLAKERSYQRTSNHNDGTYGLALYGNGDLPVDIKESLKVLGKHQEAPSFVNEPREFSLSSLYQSKDGSFFSFAKEAPRFSCDGKEVLHSSFEQRDISKSYLKYQDLPRHSLDSRGSSMQSLKSEPQAHLFLKPLQNGNASCNIPRNQQQNSGTQMKSLSVVAKLMGLEALPNSVSYSESKTSSSKTTIVQGLSCYSRTSNTVDPSRPIQVSVQSKILSKESNSPRWKNSGSSIKPVSRLPLELAPWKQVDGNQRSSKAAPKDMKDPLKTPNSFPSVYSEIEKRLKDLEFLQSGKDLRALKQILEAMQEKGEDPRFAADQKGPVHTSLKPQNDLIYSFTKQGGNFSRNYESPIVIMKPAKQIERCGNPVSVIPPDEPSGLPEIQGGALVDIRNSANGRASKCHIPTCTSRDNVSNNVKSSRRVPKSTQISTRSLWSAKEGSTGSLQSSGSVCPRISHKKQESEKHSKPTKPSTDSGRLISHSNKQQTGSSSPSGRRRPNSSSIQRSDDEMSEISNDSTNLGCLENENSAQSDGSILSESRMDIEVTSSERSLEMIHCQSPLTKALHDSFSCLIAKKSVLHRSEDELLIKHPAIAPEYPSPVSVLDNIPDMDGSPSPIKRKVKTSGGYETWGSDILPSSDQHNAAANLSADAEGFGPPTEINRKKLKNIESLVQKLQRVNSSHDEARMDYIALLCENANPDHRYISEILLASGFLLSDIGSSLTNFQFHPSGHPINPRLFLVLEQTKASSFLENDCPPGKAIHLRVKQKIHRKLIFDTINELLARKLAPLGPSSQLFPRSHNLARKTLYAQKLLRELCLETDELQAKKTKCNLEDGDDGLRNVLKEDVIRPSESWTDNISEVPGVVLDLERLIFKDLVDEVLIGETPGLKYKAGRRRQLFPK